MADIEQYLRAILQATFGEQVRGSIHDAIEVMNTESEGSRADASAAQRSASVVENAFTVTNGLMDQARAWHNEWEEVVGNINYGIYPMGPATVATLPLEPNVGWMYYMTQPDITDDRFLEGAGIELLQGQKVYFTNKGKWSIMIADGIVQQVETNRQNIDKNTSDIQFLNEREYWVSYTIVAELWNQETGEYSFEEDYPSSEYDIEDILIDSEGINEEQMKMWMASICGGYYPSNIIIAKGVIPAIDIPVKLQIKRKEAE